MTEEKVDSTSDERTVNNIMRHEYRVLNDAEKGSMRDVKDEGARFVRLLHFIGNPEQIGGEFPTQQRSRELSIAQTKIEEAVMWAVKHITR